MSFPRYEAYKDSGVEWLGEVPEAWEIWKIAHAFNCIGSGTTPPSNEEKWYEDGEIPWITTGELREDIITDTKKAVTKEALTKFTALRVHAPGSLAIAMYGATIGRLGILGIEATTNQACCVLDSSSVLNARFVFYWLQSNRDTIIALFSTGGGQPNINQESVAFLRIPAPTIEEQTQIAQFLDHETARIDALIAEQERLIALLKEKRQAVISHAVTKGCDRTVPMKDSGVEWIGEVPEHWTYGLKLLNLALEEQHSFVNGPFGSDLLASEITEEGVPVIYSGDVKAGSFLRKSSKYVTPEKAKQLNFCRVDPGDLLLAKVGDPPGEAAIYPKNSVVGIVTQDVVRVKVDQKKAAASYVRYLLNSDAGRYAIKLISVESTRNRFSLGDFKAIRVCIPTFSDQIKIVQFLDNETAHIDALVEQANKGVRLLQERRSALISAAVTGKIDVRNWQPPTSKASIPMLEAVHR